MKKALSVICEVIDVFNAVFNILYIIGFCQRSVSEATTVSICAETKKLQWWSVSLKKEWDVKVNALKFILGNALFYLLPTDR